MRCVCVRCVCVVCVRCVCASLLLCVTQLNMEGEVTRIGRLHITHNLCSHETLFFSVALPCSHFHLVF